MKRTEKRCPVCQDGFMLKWRDELRYDPVEGEVSDKYQLYCRKCCRYFQAVDY